MRSRTIVGLGALSLALALAGACNKKGTTGGGGTGGAPTGSGASGNTGSSGSTVTGMSGASSAAGKSGGSGSTSSGSGGTASAAGKSGGTGGTGTGSGGTGAGTGGTTTTGTCPGAPGCPACKGSGTALTGACEANANGEYAMQITIDAWWDEIASAGIQLVTPGRGKIVIYLKGDLSGVCEDGTGGMGVMHACGAVLPPFVNDILCEAYQLKFPDALWDSDKMPTFKAAGSTDGFVSGSTLTIAQATGLVGVDVMDPVGAWPTDATKVMCAAGTADKCFPDHDGDGKPGVSVTLNKGGMDATVMCSSGSNPTFAGAPIDALQAALGGARATTLYMGIRNGLGGGGKINDDCKTGGGPALATTIDSRIIGCMRDDGMACMAADWQFVDMNSPVYKILKSGDKPSVTSVDQTASMGPQAKVVRMADPGATVTCADVRNAFK